LDNFNLFSFSILTNGSNVLYGYSYEAKQASPKPPQGAYKMENQNQDQNQNPAEELEIPEKVTPVAPAVFADLDQLYTYYRLLVNVPVVSKAVLSSLAEKVMYVFGESNENQTFLLLAAMRHTHKAMKAKAA
jgi:hypothetical protein